MTIRSLINSSLRLIGVLASGEAATADEAQDSLECLNSMIASWSLDGFLLNVDHRDVFTLNPGAQKYTIGVDPDPIGSPLVNHFESSLVPIEINKISVLRDNVETFIKVCDDKEWNKIYDKNATDSLVCKAKFNYEYPLASLEFWPIPNTADQIVVYSRKPLAKYSSINDEINLPESYNKALRYNLAVELAPEFGKEASTTVFTNAATSKADISRINMKIPVLCNGTSRFNIITGDS